MLYFSHALTQDILSFNKLFLINIPGGIKLIINNVMLKLKNNTEEAVLKVKEELLSMKDSIEFLNDIIVELNTREGESNFDILFITMFESTADFDSYITHPVHVKVSQNIGNNIEQSAAVYFESDLN
jgi:Stress responsive A/B Barrel Domain.